MLLPGSTRLQKPITLQPKSCKEYAKKECARNRSNDWGLINEEQAVSRLGPRTTCSDRVDSFSVFTTNIYLLDMFEV